MEQGLHIGKVARETGLSIHAIRFYERDGLLRQPVRSGSGYRLFDKDTVNELKFIGKAQKLGFTLAEIREFLVLRRTTRGCAHVRDLLNRKLGAVRSKISELEKLEAELRSALRQCNRTLRKKPANAEKACPVLEELARTNGSAEG